MRDFPDIFDDTCIEESFQNIRQFISYCKNVIAARNQEIKELVELNAQMRKTLENMNMKQQEDLPAIGRCIAREHSYTYSDEELNRAFNSEGVINDSAEILSNSFFTNLEADISLASTAISQEAINANHVVAGQQQQNARKREAPKMLEKTHMHFNETEHTDISSGSNVTSTSPPASKKPRNSTSIGSWLESVEYCQFGVNDSGIPLSIPQAEPSSETNSQEIIAFQNVEQLHSLSLFILSPQAPEIVFVEDSSVEERPQNSTESLYQTKITPGF